MKEYHGRALAGGRSAADKMVKQLGSVGLVGKASYPTDDLYFDDTDDCEAVEVF